MPTPARRRLNKARVLHQAGAIMHQHGAQGLTIRSLAAALKVTPMAIYRHFKNKDALLSALLDDFIRDAQVLPPDSLDWDQWLIHMGRRMYAAQAASPMWIGLLGSLQVPHQGLVVMNRCVDRLVAAGFSDAQALRAFFAVVQISMGAALLHSGLEKLDPASALHPDNQLEAQKLLQRFNSTAAVMDTPAIDASLATLVAGLRVQLEAAS